MSIDVVGIFFFEVDCDVLDRGRQEDLVPDAW